MKIRNVWKKAESFHEVLSEKKTVSSHRRYPLEEDEDILTSCDRFIADEWKGTGSKVLRASAWKTQVFSFPKTPLIRSRLTHTVEASGISVRASEFLGLNTNLVRAGTLLHDIGHTPFGHQGEMWMKKALGRPEFCHEIMGVVIAQKIERKGAGLNLTWHTLRMIARNHGSAAKLGTFEELELLGITDGICYLLADANDIGVRGKYPFSQELRDTLNYFGENQRQRTNTIISGLVIESAECRHVSFQHSMIAKKFRRLRELMYDIYPRVTQQNVSVMMDKLLECLTRLDVGDPYLLAALMTDKDVASFTSRSDMSDLHAFNETAVAEIVPHLPAIYERHGNIDLCDPDLDW